MDRIYHAPPTAELEPLNQGQIAQTDEVNFPRNFQMLLYMCLMHVSRFMH